MAELPRGGGVGREIAYALRWQVFPMRWRSRISEFRRNVLFADEMVSGPYRRWYHRHLFEPSDGGVTMTDVVEYELPLGPLGALSHTLVVGRQLEAIFDYRAEAVEAVFAASA